MDSVFLEFQFLDLSGVSNEEVQQLLQHLRPGNVVPALELPWSVTKPIDVSSNAVVEAKDIARLSVLDSQLPSQHELLPPNNPNYPQLGISPIDHPVVPISEAPPQFSANAPVFIPASLPTLPPFAGIPPNMGGQFPPQFLQRPAFSSYSLPPQLDSSPPANNNLIHQMHHRHDSPTNRHHYQQREMEETQQQHDSNNRGPSVHKGNRHYMNNPRKSNHTHHHLKNKSKSLAHSDAVIIDVSSPPGNALLEYGNVGRDDSGNGPNMVPIPHHPPFPVAYQPAQMAPPPQAYQTAPQAPQQQIYFYHSPYSYIQPGAPNSPIMAQSDGSENMVVAPPPGLYEGSPLTMSSHVAVTHHLPPQQTYQHISNAAAAVSPIPRQSNSAFNHQKNGVAAFKTPERSYHNSGQVRVDDDATTRATREPETEKNVPVLESRSSENVIPENVDDAPGLNELTNVSTRESEQVEYQIESQVETLPSETPPESNTVLNNEPEEISTVSETPDNSNSVDNMEDSGVDLDETLPAAPLPTPKAPAAVSNEPGKSWADLFKANGNASKSSSIGSALETSNKTAASNAVNRNGHAKDDSFANDYEIREIGKLLQSYKADFTPQPFQPRGLINRSNWCYINATLQALLVCAPFHNLIKTLQNMRVRTSAKSKTPIMFSLVKLISEFDSNNISKRKKNKEDPNMGLPFEPVCMHAMLTLIKSECIKGRQEDAEEFLSCILNGLHDEMVAIIKTVENKGCNGQSETTNGHLETASEDDTEDEWRMMGPKGKGSGTVTRTSAHLSPTPIKAIFGGMTRSLLTSGTESSATLQPFFTLQLDIQGDGVDSVEDALSHLIVKESIQGYTCSKTKKEVEASRCMSLEELPPVLILHFKRFVYDDKDGGSKKVLKKMDYPLDLELKKDLLSPGVRQRYSAKFHRNYRLFAVVYHDGKEAVKGHYVADVFHAGINSWLHCDDRNIKPISEENVLTYNSPCVPYLLFYGREIPNQATATATTSK